MGQIKAFGRPVINKCNVIRPEQIHSVPSCMTCGIIMLKKSDTGIILKQWEDVPRKNVTAVVLVFKFPSITTRLVHVMPAQIKTEGYRSSTQQWALRSILEPYHHLDDW